MSSTDGEIGMRNPTDKATQERLEKDVAAVKNDIAALTDQITDALNSFAGTAKKQARRGYKEARANVDSAVDDMRPRTPPIRSKKRWKTSSRSARSRRWVWRLALAF